MDQLKDKILSFLKEYRWIILLFSIGIVLMIPGQKQEEPQQEEAKLSMDLSQSLERILSQIEGVGETEVLLTEKVSIEQIYQADISADRQETVIISDADKNQQPLVQYTNSPVYMGAIIVCQGGGDPNIQLKILEAVRSVTGLPADKICVVKMKSLEE